MSMLTDQIKYGIWDIGDKDDFITLKRKPVEVNILPIALFSFLGPITFNKVPEKNKRMQ